MELLQQTNDHDVDVDKIYIHKQPKQDKLVWHYTKDGHYTVKTGYWLVSQEREQLTTQPPGNIETKTKIWSSPLAPKLKIFIWRALSHALGTTSSLFTRGIPIDPMCQHCSQAHETPNHILFTCPIALTTWSSSLVTPFRQAPPSDNIDENFNTLFDSPHHSPNEAVDFSTPFWTTWSLWKVRNDRIFNGRL